jgi:pimeloyl-ACP methyl ester carboxylesterase
VRKWDAERISQDAHLIRHPTLILWGENDREVPLQNGESLHQQIQDSQLIIFRECGHLPHEEFPVEFAQVVSHFCSDQQEKQLRVAIG